MANFLSLKTHGASKIELPTLDTTRPAIDYTAPINLFKVQTREAMISAMEYDDADDYTNYNEVFRTESVNKRPQTYKQSTGRSSVPLSLYRENTYNMEFKQDWTDVACSIFLKPVKEFLSAQKEVERASLIRCSQNYRGRVNQFETQEKERRLREFDEKIRLKLLLKQADKRSSDVTSSMSCHGQKDKFKSSMARQLSEQAKPCERCALKHRKYEQVLIKNLELDLNTNKSITSQTPTSLLPTQLPDLRKPRPKLSYSKSFHNYSPSPRTVINRNVSSSTSNTDLVKITAK